MPSNINLLTNAGVGTTGTTIKLKRGGRMGFFCTGTFSGASVTIEVSNDGVEFVPLQSGITAALYTVKDVYADYIRAVTTGGTTPSIDVVLVRN